MVLFKSRYRIPSSRLKNWDYGSPGLYFVTINMINRESYFGEMENKYKCKKQIINIQLWQKKNKTYGLKF